MGFPYEWQYTTRWPYYYFFPSTRRHTDLPPQPARQDFAEHPCDIRLLFLGDLMCMRGGRVPNVCPELNDLLSDADLVIGNCEAPVLEGNSVNPDKYRMSINFLREFLDRLGIVPGRCMLSVANNHIGDQGEAGLLATLENMAKIGVTPVGQWLANAAPVSAVSCQGVRLGIAAWSQWFNRDPFQANPGAWRTQHIDAQNWREIKTQLQLDLLLGAPHWEYEFQHFPRPPTQRFACRLMDDGFDLIVGHHPHLLQPLERYKESLCFYSIGNLNGPDTFPYMAWPLRQVCVVEVRIGRGNGDRESSICGYTVHFFAQVRDGDGISIVPMRAAPPGLREKLDQRLALHYLLGRDDKMQG